MEEVGVGGQETTVDAMQGIDRLGFEIGAAVYHFEVVFQSDIEFGTLHQLIYMN